MSVVRQCSSKIGGAAGLSSTSLRGVFAEISEHSTDFHLKLVEFGAKCAARARENGGEDDGEDETVVEEEEEDTAAAVAAAAITQQAEQQQEEEATAGRSHSGSLPVEPEPEDGSTIPATTETESGEAEAPQAELRDRYALGALKRVRYKLDGK
jgi:hypothetical protein|eukprot:COSAG02_NODE_1899_length_10459_cov_5.376544_4_plen_154_part_00